MRIVLGTETFLPHVDGIVTRLTQTVTHLQQSGDEVLIVAPYRPDAPREFAGAQVLAVPSLTVPGYPDLRFGMPWLPPPISRVIERFAPQVVHVAAPAALGVGVVIAARRRHVPLVASYHVQYPEYVRRYYRLGFALPVVWRILRLIHNR